MKTIPEAMKETEVVLLDRIYSQSPAAVWRALTNRRALERWLLPNDFQPKPGHRFSFRGPRRRIECEVVTLVEEKRLAYTWREGDEPLSLVSWTLEPVPEGTRVRLRHEPLAMASTGAHGLWTRALNDLATVCAPLSARLTSVRQRQTGVILFRQRRGARVRAIAI